LTEAFAHDALLRMEPSADVRAPGAAITVALCGHWEHEGPCPLAPHHTHAERGPDGVRLRIRFEADPADEPEVRTRIDTALATGELEGSDGVLTRWELVSSAPLDLT
jgi:hypothetical protein